MLHEQIANRTSELVLKKREHKPREHEPTSTRPVPYSDISGYTVFKKEKEQVVIRVLIKGGAGIGKTTFCLTISKDWGNKKLFKEFEVLLYDRGIFHASQVADVLDSNIFLCTCRGMHVHCDFPYCMRKYALTKW